MQVNISSLISKIWNSPTIATWASFLSKSLSLVVILPLILTRLTAAEISLWYVFSTIIGLQILIDLGFSPTFSRVIAYAMGGATQVKDFRFTVDNIEKKKPNWKIIYRILSTIRFIYFRLSFVLVLFLATFGTWSILKVVSQIQYPLYAWIAWVVIVITSAITLQGNVYVCYLQGINQIALLRRWEAITSIAAIITSFIILTFGGGLLGLVIANQGSLLINVLRNRRLSRICEQGRFFQFQTSSLDPKIFQSVWPSAWRSGIGVFMTYGLVQLSGIVYAQVGSASEVASYLLGLKMIQTISQFSQAPFYSKLPLQAKLRSEGNLEQQVTIAQRSMMLSYWTYVIGFIVVGVFMKPLLSFIGSNVEFVSPVLWSLMGLAVFIERYGAMHLQLYSTTNHIIWHTVTGISGSIYLVVSVALFGYIGVYAFPVGLLASYLGFYSWYSAKHSYDAYGLKFWDFERSVFLPPFFLLLAHSICVLVGAL